MIDAENDDSQGKGPGCLLIDESAFYFAWS